MRVIRKPDTRKKIVTAARPWPRNRSYNPPKAGPGSGAKEAKWLCITTRIDRVLAKSMIWIFQGREGLGMTKLYRHRRGLGKVYPDRDELRNALQNIPIEPHCPLSGLQEHGRWGGEGVGTVELVVGPGQDQQPRLGMNRGKAFRLLG